MGRAVMNGVNDGRVCIRSFVASRVLVALAMTVPLTQTV
jgi:hypothetical protein